MTNAVVRTVRTVTLLLLTSLSTVAQEFGYEAGYIVTKSMDTIQGSVKYASTVPFKIPKKIKFEPKTGMTQEYAPDELHAFKAANRVFYSMRLPSNYLRSSNGFLELVTDGPMKLYVYYYTESGPDGRGSYLNKTYFLQKEGLDSLLTVESGKKFKKDVGNYLSDVTELSEKVKSGKYKQIDILRVVAEYNRLKQR